MKRTPLTTCLTAAVCVLIACIASPAQAEVTFSWVTVGNPGNADDLGDPTTEPDVGSVGYRYQIAEHEVTNAQYAAFLNAMAAVDSNDLYNPSMGTDPRGGITQAGSSGAFTYHVKTNMGNKPVNYVSFFDAMRFVNWLYNGQPSGPQGPGTTEAGVYTIGSGISESRAAEATYFIPTENEWYKAAYHQPAVEGGDSDDYWRYPTATNGVPTVATANSNGDISPSGTNVANYLSGADWNGQNGNVTSVGSVGPLSASFYGTSDQGGNVFEWNETVFSTCCRGLRGGSRTSNESGLRSSFQDEVNPAAASSFIGFRVARLVPLAVAIPTVSEWGLIIMTASCMVGGVIIFRRSV